MPDQELLDLAAKGKLADPAVLREQAERLLRDPKAPGVHRELRRSMARSAPVEFTLPDERLYPEFDELLQHSMPKETLLFFDEILQERPSVLQFRRFGLRHAQRASGAALRHHRRRRDGISQGEVAARTATAAACWRHASILRLTANGTTTSPVVRGAWVLRQHHRPAAGAAARRRAGRRTRPERGHHHPPAPRQAPGRRAVPTATPRSILWASPWKVST